jgi:hypothetical protein
MPLLLAAIESYLFHCLARVSLPQMLLTEISLRYAEKKQGEM